MTATWMAALQMAEPQAAERQAAHRTVRAAQAAVPTQAAERRPAI
jgi:hypothetical protein